MGVALGALILPALPAAVAAPSGYTGSAQALLLSPQELLPPASGYQPQPVWTTSPDFFGIPFWANCGEAGWPEAAQEFDAPDRSSSVVSDAIVVAPDAERAQTEYEQCTTQNVTPAGGSPVDVASADQAATVLDNPGVFTQPRRVVVARRDNVIAIVQLWDGEPVADAVTYLADMVTRVAPSGGAGNPRGDCSAELVSGQRGVVLSSTDFYPTLHRFLPLDHQSEQPQGAECRWKATSRAAAPPPAPGAGPAVDTVTLAVDDLGSVSAASDRMNALFAQWWPSAPPPVAVPGQLGDRAFFTVLGQDGQAELYVREDRLVMKLDVAGPTLVSDIAADASGATAAHLVTTIAVLVLQRLSAVPEEPSGPCDLASFTLGGEAGVTVEPLLPDNAAGNGGIHFGTDGAASVIESGDRPPGGQPLRHWLVDGDITLQKGIKAGFGKGLELGKENAAVGAALDVSALDTYQNGGSFVYDNLSEAEAAWGAYLYAEEPQNALGTALIGLPDILTRAQNEQRVSLGNSVSGTVKFGLINLASGQVGEAVGFQNDIFQGEPLATDVVFEVNGSLSTQIPLPVALNGVFNITAPLPPDIGSTLEIDTELGVGTGLTLGAENDDMLAALKGASLDVSGDNARVAHVHLSMDISDAAHRQLAIALVRAVTGNDVSATVANIEKVMSDSEITITVDNVTSFQLDPTFPVPLDAIQLKVNAGLHMESSTLQPASAWFIPPHGKRAYPWTRCQYAR